MLPLRWLHAIGAAIGWLVYRLSPSYAARLRENLRQSGICGCEAVPGAILARAVAEAGRGVLEVLPVWFRSDAWVDRIVCERDGVDAIDRALARGKGVVFLTPHLGCYEVAARYGALRFPITILYRPPRQRWLEPLLRLGRLHGQATLATTDFGGVRKLLAALRRGEAVGLLPDQAPAGGQGEWAPFFGRPAYTMTLPQRLVAATGATVLFAHAGRLSRGRGFRLSIRELDAAATAPDALNRAIEALVRTAPEEYLWGYNRYKVPRGAAPPADG
jgi:KDO2-lipid IV(A) lauroyltransferase